MTFQFKVTTLVFISKKSFRTLKWERLFEMIQHIVLVAYPTSAMLLTWLFFGGILLENFGDFFLQIFGFFIHGQTIYWPHHIMFYSNWRETGKMHQLDARRNMWLLTYDFTLDLDLGFSRLTKINGVMWHHQDTIPSTFPVHSKQMLPIATIMITWVVSIFRLYSNMFARRRNKF